MPMTQADIRSFYQRHWKEQSDGAHTTGDLASSSPIEDRVLYPLYARLLRDLAVRVDGGRVLDIGCGSGRWIRFFLENFRPALLRGMDVTPQSIELLQRWHPTAAGTRLEYRVGDITSADLSVDEPFDCINIANVLFHIPEVDLFTRALANLARLVAPGGRIFTTEYLPRCAMRTEWMLVRSRYQFEEQVREAGLRILTMRAFGFFANDPMGVDGPDSGTRGYFHRVRTGIQNVLKSPLDASNRTYFIDLFAEIERALLAFCGERMADIELPAQKLVVLARGD